MGSGTRTHQTTNFLDGVSSWKVDASSTRGLLSATDTTSVPLGEFFARPVKIYERDWQESDSGDLTSIDPWALFFSDARVANRLNNFNVMRCRLRLKIVINANPFMLGRMCVHYRPLASQTEIAFNNSSIGVSQLPHIFIDPATDTGGDMVLPFFWKKNYFHVPTKEWENTSSLGFRIFQQLEPVNSGLSASSATISIFAWTEDIEMGAPTTTNIVGLEAQSEFADSPISTPASAIQRVAAALSSLPMIGPFAKATEIGAGAVSNIAKLFGYSRPSMIDPPRNVRIRQSGNLACTNVPDNSEVLALDVKNELTIDPACLGLETSDPLSIANVCMKESYLTSFTWSTIDSSGKQLFEANVSPVLYDVISSIIFPTPAAHMSAAFKYWRGKMKFRFDIVGTKFHRGRLRISYDPYTNANAFNYNTVYSTVIDLSHSRQGEIVCGWGSPSSFLACDTMTTSIVPFNTLSDGSAHSGIANSNGLVRVEVLNILGVPDEAASSDVAVNVFVSMCDDVEFAAPLTSPGANDLHYFQAQSDFCADTECGPGPEGEGIESMQALDSVQLDQSNLVYMGEKIVSLRSLLKRYYRFRTWTTETNTNNDRTVRITAPTYPFHSGYATGAIDQDSLSNAYNFVSNTPITWFGPCYAAYRGSLRWKYIPNTTVESRMQYHTLEQLHEDNLQGTDVTALTLSTDTSDSAVARRGVIFENQGGFGMTLATTVAPIIEASIPFYSHEKYKSPRVANMTNSDNGGPRHRVFLNGIDVTSGTDYPRIASLVAAGEDFSFFWYLQAPALYEYTTPNVA